MLVKVSVSNVFGVSLAGTAAVAALAGLLGALLGALAQPLSKMTVQQTTLAIARGAVEKSGDMRKFLVTIVNKPGTAPAKAKRVALDWRALARVKKRDINIKHHTQQRRPKAQDRFLALNESRWWVEVSQVGVCVKDKRKPSASGSMALWRTGAAQLLARLRWSGQNRGPRALASQLNNQLGVGPNYGKERALTLQREPGFLLSYGTDRYGRSVWLAPKAGRAWLKMRETAKRAGIAIDVVSAFRSFHYQASLLRRKRLRGEELASILQVSAAPGYSEHHSGCALDLAEIGAAALEEDFAQTEAFQWLQKNADRFGFVMSFPANNRHGVLFEPWHWCYRPRDTGTSANRLRVK